VIARTLRERFGVGLSDLGGALKWGEARLLIEAAAGDPSTEFGADLAGWSYAADAPTLLGIVVQAPKAWKSLMPWVMKRPESSTATADEIAAAEAALEAEVVFT
jgi:hypothetical protein